MTSAKVYPGGVVNRGSDSNYTNEYIGKLVITKPDEVIAGLHHSNYGTIVNNESFDYKKAVIEACIRLYGNFYNWVLYQLLYNRFLHGTNQDFLIDTIWYIKTGERKMMLPVWQSVLTQYPDIGPVKSTRLQDTTLESFLTNPSNKKNPFSNYITEWTSHPDGLYDMIYTTYLLFGNVDTTTLSKHNLV